ncbi:Alpha/Beta hydrolase protein [Pavlovales sp. CCMP2436]|nr:Alpha/Beta hydrolase protein [Pavlovales sp. CCMP2436]
MWQTFSGISDAIISTTQIRQSTGRRAARWTAVGTGVTAQTSPPPSPPPPKPTHTSCTHIQDRPNPAQAARMVSAELKEWAAKGAPLEVANNPATMIWRMGSGPTVVCIHGVPSSAYLYRKVLPELAGRGLEGVALDLPGLGLADRPLVFDYTWTVLGAWLVKALEAAKNTQYHLVLHDLGGPVGFEAIHLAPDRVLSLTVLNTDIKSAVLSKPTIVKDFSVLGLKNVMVSSMISPIIYPFFRSIGMYAGPSFKEIRVNGEPLARLDGDSAYAYTSSPFNPAQPQAANLHGAG